MRREDIAQVAQLYRFVDKSDWRIPADELPKWLERTLFGHPWVDSEIPSLVYVDDSGEILGFVGSHVRRMRFDGQPIRMAAGGPLIAHPDVRNRGVGARLLRTFFTGAQDLTITDGASDEIRQIFELVGGQMMHPSSMVWARVFRPFSYVGNRALHANVHVRHRVKPWARRVLPALDVPANHASRYFQAPHGPSTTDELLTPQLLLENLALVTRSLRLAPDYDQPMLEWLFAELHHNRTWGTPHRRLVRSEAGRVLGWYVYYALPGEGCQVIQLAAHDRHEGAVLDNLFAHAFAHGGAAVQGRVEGRTLPGLARRGALFRFSPRSLIFANNTDLLGAVTSGHALLTRLEGEWWMAT
jgi:GNAT superfamily N-acetyltransferase